RAARGADADERQLLLDRDAHPAHEALADHRAHRPAHEVELECRAHQAERLDRALHHHQRIALGGLLLRLRQALGIAPRILELERIERQHLGADLEAPVGIEQRIEARPCAEALVVAALRADVQVLLEVRAVEHRIAGRALGPQALGDALASAGAGALDLGGQQLLQPAHLENEASSAWRIGRRNVLTRASASAGAASISWIRRLPITTASAVSATRRADSASRMPKPTPIGRWVAARICGMRLLTSERSRCAAPVTPRSET